MQILIFGASGTLGKHIVEQALEKGYTVKAFTRDPEKLQKLKNNNLKIIQGDLRNFEDVIAAMDNTNVVMCAVGDGNKGDIRAQATINIIDAMKKSGIKRFVCQTTLGMGQSYNNLNFFWKYLMFGLILKNAFLDHEQQEKYILESDLDFTIVRPSAFTDKNLNSKYKIDFDSKEKKLKLKINRQDIASFMLEQISSDDFIRKTVSISN